MVERTSPTAEASAMASSSLSAGMRSVAQPPVGSSVEDADVSSGMTPPAPMFTSETLPPCRAAIDLRSSTAETTSSTHSSTEADAIDICSAPDDPATRPRDSLDAIETSPAAGATSETDCSTADFSARGSRARIPYPTIASTTNRTATIAADTVRLELVFIGSPSVTVGRHLGLSPFRPGLKEVLIHPTNETPPEGGVLISRYGVDRGYSDLASAGATASFSRFLRTDAA